MQLVVKLGSPDIHQLFARHHTEALCIVQENESERASEEERVSNNTRNGCEKELPAQSDGLAESPNVQFIKFAGAKLFNLVSVR